MATQKQQTWWQRQMTVYRADIARWTQRLPRLRVQQPFGRRIGRAVQPMRVGKQSIAPWIIAIVLGVFAIVSIIERVAR